MKTTHAQTAQAIRKELKQTFPNLKFGVRKDHSSSVNVTIKQGDVDFSDLFRPEDDGYAQINQYWLDRTGDHKSMFQKVFDIIKTAPIRGDGYRKGTGWYDNSDSQIDYFDTAYYINVNVGSWNQPYIQSK